MAVTTSRVIEFDGHGPLHGMIRTRIVDDKKLMRTINTVCGCGGSAEATFPDNGDDEIQTQNAVCDGCGHEYVVRWRW